MANRKIYSTPGKLSVSIVVNNERQRIHFTGVDSIKRRKLFITTDKDVQEALENSGAFNTFFQLDKTEKIKELEVSKPDVAVADVPDDQEKKEEDTEHSETPEPKKGLPQKEVTDLPEAKRWLSGLGVAVDRKTKIIDAKESAKKLGFELIFKTQKSE